MNIPPEVARAQGKHGIKGAAHGSKGGRPRLDLSAEERVEHRRKQQEAYRRRNGIQPRKAHSPGVPRKKWVRQYVDIWGKLPDEPLTPEEFEAREPIWNANVLKLQEAAKHREAEWERRKLERQKRSNGQGRQDPVRFPSPLAATPSVGRNQPCPCGSGRKFKKCCGR